MGRGLGGQTEGRFTGSSLSIKADLKMVLEYTPLLPFTSDVYTCVYSIKKQVGAVFLTIMLCLNIRHMKHVHCTYMYIRFFDKTSYFRCELFGTSGNVFTL